MGRIAVDIGKSVKDVVLSGDPERVAELVDDDNDRDHLHRRSSQYSWTENESTVSHPPSTTRSSAATTNDSQTTPSKSAEELSSKPPQNRVDKCSAPRTGWPCCPDGASHGASHLEVSLTRAA